MKSRDLLLQVTSNLKLADYLVETRAPPIHIPTKKIPRVYLDDVMVWRVTCDVWHVTCDV